MIKRLFDFVMAIIATIIFFLPMLGIAILIKLTSHGPIIFWSNRIGKANNIFAMPKFRTMNTNTPLLATHLLSGASEHLTPIGKFLRRSSLDELPQLWSVMIGDMSFVGPRPALYNQLDLIEMRTANGVDQLLPGITGLAQINGRDELPEELKVGLDVEYLKRQSFWLDQQILILTIIKVFKREGISH